MSLVLGIFLGNETKKNNTDNIELNEIKKNNKVEKNDIENETDLETDKDAWPPKIVEYLENCLFPQYNEKAISTTESCTWVNILFARYFLELRNAKDFKERMKKKLNDKLSRKLKNISYIQSVELTDFNFGDVSPYFNGVRVKKSSSEKLEVNLEMEIEYSGAPNSISFNLDIRLSKGIIIPVKIKLLKCNGTLLIVLPYLKDPTLFGVTFINNPNPEFSIEVLSNKFKDKKKYFLTPVFSVLNKVLKSFFLEYWTLPAIRTFDLPLVAPKIPIYVYVSNDNKTNNVCAPQPIQSTKRHTNSQRSLDIILDKTFPIYTHVSSNNASLFNERLTSTFVYLAKENNNDIYKLLEKRQSIDQSPLAYEFWKTIKNKHGIHVQKKQMNEYGERGCIFKGTFVVRMNPKNAYNIITNMSNEASGYVFSDTFIRSSIIKRFNNDTLVRHLLFKLNRQQNHGYIVFEAHKKIEDDDENDILDQALSVDKTLMSNEGEENKNNKYVIVWRSIAGIKNEEIEENILQKENDNIPITDLHKGKLRSYTVNDSLDKEGRKISLNKPIYEMDQKTPILMENEKILLLKTDSFLKSKQSTSKEQSTLTSSFHSLNSLSLICKNETEPLMDILKKPIQLTDKMVQSPTVKPKEMSIKNENSFRNSSTDDKIYNNNISDINERRKKESLKINDNPSNNENSESKQSEALDLMVTSSKDYLMVMENYKINTKPVGMFKLSLSDDEELVSYDNNLNSNRTDSSTSSLTSLSEKYEDTASVILDNEFSLSTRKSNEKLDIELSDNEKTIGTSILESKVINTNDNKSNLYQTSKDANLTNIISNTDNDKSELFENINALYIKGFYLEPQLGDPESCYLTVISQYEPSFKKFEANYEYCRKLKKFLEDHNQIINNSSNTNSMEEDKRKSFTRSVSGENIAKLGKIKNYISNGLVKVKRSHNSVKDTTKLQTLKNNIISNKLKPESINNNNNNNNINNINNINKNSNSNATNNNINNITNVGNNNNNSSSRNSSNNVSNNSINNKNNSNNSNNNNLKSESETITNKINSTEIINLNKFKPDDNLFLNIPNVEVINEKVNVDITNNIMLATSKGTPNDDELSRTIPVPPTSSMPNTTATSINNQNSSVINSISNMNSTSNNNNINTNNNNNNNNNNNYNINSNNKKGVINIFKRVQKVVTKRGSIGDDRNTSKVEDEINSSMLLSDTCRSTDSVNTLDEDREREVHTKNNIVTLKHINKPNIPLYNQNFTNQFINNKETIRVESQHLGGETWNELRFEFNEAKNLPLDFSISFKPTILSMFDKWKHIYNESPTEPGVFMILPTFTCYTSQTLKIINGCLSIYDFPAGIFIYKWENNARKTPKHISFRFAIQPVTLLISPQNSLSQYCNEYNSVVSIKQRSCGKFFVRYIPLNEQCYKSIGISGRTAFLNYQIYTKGSDIQFGIIYESLQENSTQLPEIQSSLTMEASSNVRKKSNLNRKTSSLTNIPNEENYNSNENLTDEAKLKQISEVVSSSPKMEKYDSENQFIINDMHPNSTNIVKDNFELKPNQRFVIPISKCNSHKNVLNGTIPISNKFGTYTFIFNNSFSIVTSKTLELNIKLLIL